MTQTTPRRTPSAEPGPERRGFAALVPLGRIFDPDRRDALLLIGTTVFLLGLNTTGVQNPLFFKENTSMLFGDARARVDDILAAL